MTETRQTTTQPQQGAQQAMQLTPEQEARLNGMGLALIAADAPDRPAVITEAYGSRTYGELNAQANRLVRALRARGLQAGHSLGVACSNRPELIETLTAAQRMGVRLTPINWHLTGEEIAYILTDCEATAFIADTRFAEAAAEAAKLTPGVKIRLAVGTDEDLNIEGFEPYDDAVAAEPGDNIPDPQMGGSMLYTSGTTGRPKGVHRPGGGLGAGSGAAAPAAPAAAAGLAGGGAAPAAASAAGDGDAAAQALAARRSARAQRGEGAGRERPGAYKPGEDSHLLTGPGYHAAPLAFSIRAPLGAGATVVMMDGWDPEETLRLIEKHRITHTHMVPTMFHRLLALPEQVRSRYDTSSLRYVLHGAAPCPVEVKKALMDWLGPIVHEYYAATEGSGTSIGPEEWLQKPGSVGKPLGNIEIQDDQGGPAGPNEVGTVYLRAGRARFEYYKDPEKTSSAFRGDHFTLGDMGYLDEDGYLFLTGRSAEVIISGGVNIYPVEVDEVLLTHPAVADVATVGVPNDDWGEEVKAVVLLKGGYESSDALASELIEFCRDRLARFKCPRSVDFTDELPRHDTGKIYRRLVRDRYWAGRTKTI